MESHILPVLGLDLSTKHPEANHLMEVIDPGQ